MVSVTYQNLKEDTSQEYREHVEAMEKMRDVLINMPAVALELRWLIEGVEAWDDLVHENYDSYERYIEELENDLEEAKDSEIVDERLSERDVKIVELKERVEWLENKAEVDQYELEKTQKSVQYLTGVNDAYRTQLADRDKRILELERDVMSGDWS